MNKPTDIRLLRLTLTSIEFVGEENMWRFNVFNSNVTGTSTASFASFTLGKHNWTIKGDKGCSSKDSYTTELKMSGCTRGNFTCNNGQCVDMSKRCNQLPHCEDTSDEVGCDILILKDGYNARIPPISPEHCVEVKISIDILKLYSEMAVLHNCYYNLRIA